MPIRYEKRITRAMLKAELDPLMSEAPKTVWPSDADYRSIRSTAEQALEAIRSGEARADMGAVNWADLRVVEVSFCRDEHGDCHWRVLVEEASPGCGLGHAIYLRLAAAHPDEVFDVVTEW